MKGLNSKSVWQNKNVKNVTELYSKCHVPGLRYHWLFLLWFWIYL